MGLVNTHLSWEETLDPSACNTNDPVGYEKASRDPARTPFPWNDSPNAGFSTTTNKTWLPVSPDYATNNVEAQLAAENSHLKIFMKLTKLRQKPVLRQGKYEGKLVNNDSVLLYRRWYESDLAIVVLNFGENDATVNVFEAFSNITITSLPVFTASLDTIADR